MLSLRIPMSPIYQKTTRPGAFAPSPYTKEREKKPKCRKEVRISSLRVAGLLDLGLVRRVGVGHLLVLDFLRLVGLGSLARLGLGGLLGPLGLNPGLYRLALGLDLLEVALDDGPGQSADLAHLGHVDGLGGIVALVVEPVLFVTVRVLLNVCLYD